MGDNRDRVFAGFDPGRDLPGSLHEYRERLEAFVYDEDGRGL